MNLGSQRMMKMDCVAREPLHGLAAQLREAAIFEGEPGKSGSFSLPSPPTPCPSRPPRYAAEKRTPHFRLACGSTPAVRAARHSDVYRLVFLRRIQGVLLPPS